MGSGPSLPLSISDSIVKPGNKSVVSAPIQLDYDTFLEELIAWLQYPVPPALEPLLQDCTVTEGETPDDFEVKVILDPSKLWSAGLSNPDDPSLEKIPLHSKVKIDRQNRFAISENYKEYWAGERPRLQSMTRADFTEAPFRIDYFWTMPNGVRVANQKSLDALQVTVDQIIANIMDRKVAMKLDTAKKTAKCDPVDESVITYGRLFDELVYCMRDTHRSTIEESTWEKFNIIPQLEGQPYSVVTHDKGSGTIKIDVFQSPGDKGVDKGVDGGKGGLGMDLGCNGRKTLKTIMYCLSDSPLTVEAWVEIDGKKETGRRTTRMIQAHVDAAVTRAMSSWPFSLF